MNAADANHDTLLHDALSPAESAPDEAFVLRVKRLALAEQRLRIARKAAFQRLGIELAASASIAAAFLLIRYLSVDRSGGSIFSGSAAAGLMLLAVWLCISIRSEFTPAASADA